MAASKIESVVETTKLTLPQMVDISLNSGEAGLVNFNLLHALLHVMIQQSELSHTIVEFRGDDGARLKNFINSVIGTSPHITLTEYVVVDDSKLEKRRTSVGGKVNIDGTPEESKDKKAEETITVKGVPVEMTEKLKKEISRQEVAKEKVLKVIKRRKTSKEEINLEPEPLKSAHPSAYSLDKLIVVEQTGREMPQCSVTMTKAQFENFENEIKELQERVKELAEMPNNPAIIDAIKKGSDESPLLDLFQVLTLNKRIDAMDVMMGKLGSMVTDLTKNSSGVEAEGWTKIDDEVGAGSGVTSATLQDIQNRLSQVEKAILEGDIGTSGKKKKTTERNESSSEESRTKSKGSSKGDDENEEHVPLTDKKSNIEGIDLRHLPVKKAMSLIQKELHDIRSLIMMNDLVQLLKDVEELKKQLCNEQTDLPPEIRLNKVEAMFTECQSQLNSLDTMYNHQMNNLTNQLQEVEQELAATLEKINIGVQGAGDGGEHSVLELYEKLMKLQEDVAAIAESLDGVMQEKGAKDVDINAVVEQIELLKTVKADREDLEDALADKADACMVNRKVSYSQFNAIFDDLSKGIDEAISKLAQQEILWKTALGDIQMEMEKKMNKQDLSPLKDFINERLKNLQEKFKTLTALKKEHEAAGTKSKFLRNVNCISCDKDVVMRKEMDASLMPQAQPLPPNRSMGPYLAYELDQLRKQQKCLPKGKNLHYVEDALTSKHHKDKDHICNRYCGGSHTVTTPQQRVTRIGHFIQQYGPEVSPINETMVKGVDGHMYKAQDEECVLNKQDLAAQPTGQPKEPATEGSAPAAQENAKERKEVASTGCEPRSTPGMPGQELQKTVSFSASEVPERDVETSEKNN